MKLTTILAAMAGVGLIGDVALASHTEPAKAKKFQASLVNAFIPCDPPNTATQSPNSSSACAPTDTEDVSCMLTPAGSGKMTITVVGDSTTGTQGVKFDALAKGLSSGCQGETLCISLSFRFTADDCPEGTCTTVDTDNFKTLSFPSTCCTVAGGLCKIKATLLTSDIGGGLFTNGKNTGIELHGCGLAPFFPGLAEPAMTCGILLK